MITYEDRLLLAYSQLVLTQERRDGFLSDDDVLDATDAWTTDPETDDWEGRLDYERLRDDLLTALGVGEE